MNNVDEKRQIAEIMPQKLTSLAEIDRNDYYLILRGEKSVHV